MKVPFISVCMAVTCCIVSPNVRADGAPAPASVAGETQVKQSDVTGNLAALKVRLDKREADLHQEADKMKQLFKEGIVSRMATEQARKNWEAARMESERMAKQIADLTAPASATAIAQNPPGAIPLPPPPTTPAAVPAQQPSATPDIAAIARQIEATQKSIAEQQKSIGEVMDSIRQARMQIAAVKTKLDAIIADARRTKQRVHPLIAAADEYLNVPYRWGGTTSRGLDCSGLIYRALARLGIRVPHSAALLAQRGTPVSLLRLRPGDLLFFANTYKPGISHVGIYLGGDNFLHASSGAGRVTIGSLKDRYFVNHFAGARRIAK